MVFVRNILGIFKIKYESESLKIKNEIKKYSPKDPVILEAGASDGTDTIEFPKLFPNSKIYAFEPVSKNYSVLSSRVSNLKNVFIFRLALSDKNESCEINISKNVNKLNSTASSSSLLKPKEHISFHPEIVFDTKETVEATTIDSWAQKNNISKIDVLWLDLQGMEYKVLKASPVILETVKVVYSEVSLKEMYEDSLLYEDFKKWMSQQGFSVKKEYLQWEDMGNVLFVRK